MTVIKQDPRVVKTQTNLRRALVYLMQHEKLENISVQKITKTANITRGTFYLHYRDKQDFVEAAMNGIIDQLFEHVLEKGTPREVTDGKILQTMSVSETFSYIEKNADVFTVLLSGQQNRYFYQQLYNRLTEVITNYAKGLGTDLEEIDVPLRIQVTFITSALLGLIIRWLDGGLIYTPRYMTSSLEKMLNNFASSHLLIISFLDFKTHNGLEI
ncbi:TetR/AcrR family transcriptional regulator [Limosilactobacillus fermentum]|uniref:TetR/AcrR family transcriptional regulator n=1 Tax=Limosilactobacillus fermentum TaxID=1613 RepID=UPI00218215D6|nr:TetR/AcrR family transcriptional regulator [Limosilactobacillus fermentum]MCS8618415.1 TetR/AcrR family transcriptional regulator [Limosilactobacillus fermentum]